MSDIIVQSDSECTTMKGSQQQQQSQKPGLNKLFAIIFLAFIFIPIFISSQEERLPVRPHKRTLSIQEYIKKASIEREKKLSLDDTDDINKQIQEQEEIEKKRILEQQAKVKATAEIEKDIEAQRIAADKLETEKKALEEAKKKIQEDKKAKATQDQINADKKAKEEAKAELKKAEEDKKAADLKLAKDALNAAALAKADAEAKANAKAEAEKRAEKISKDNCNPGQDGCPGNDVSGTLSFQYYKTINANNRVTIIDASNNGKYFAAVVNDKEIQLYETSTWQLIKTWTSKWAIASLKISDQFVVAGSDREKGQIAIFSTQNYQQIRTLTEHKKTIKTVAFSHDGKYLVSGGNNNEINIWSTTDWKIIKSFIQTNIIISASFSSDNKYILFNFREDTKTYVLDWNTGDIKNLESDNYEKMSAIANSKLVVSPSYGHLSAWSVSDWKLQNAYGQHKHDKTITSIDLTEDLVVTGGYDFQVIASREAGKWTQKVGKHDDIVNNVVISSHGKTIISSSENIIKIWTLN